MSEKRTGWVVAAILGAILFALVVCPWVFLAGLTVVDSTFHILPRPSFETTAPERDALRQKASEIFSTVQAADTDKVLAVWESDGVQVDRKRVDPGFLKLASGEVKATGYRVEFFTSSTSPSGARSAGAAMIFELEGGSEQWVGISVSKAGDDFKLRGYPAPTD